MSTGPVPIKQVGWCVVSVPCSSSSGESNPESQAPELEGKDLRMDADNKSPAGQLTNGLYHNDG